MRIIGLTGSIACGKSTVSKELIRQGFPVIDGDLLARELTAPGGAAVNDIRSAFGDRYILPDGSMDRQAMGKLVFSDPLARNRLDHVMAPYLRDATVERIEQCRAQGAKLCFLDMPLLFEKGYDRYCDAVWCVWLPEDIQLQRLMERDGYTREESLSRMRAVMSSDEKANRSSVIIDNSGTREETLRFVDELLQREISRMDQVPRRRRASAAPEGAVPAPVPPDIGSAPAAVDRPDSFSKKAPARKASWTIPPRLRALLIGLIVVLSLSLTAQIWMNAYLARSRQRHIDEQKAIDEQYPLQYRDLIIRAAGEYNLSPSLVAAVIRNESSFRPAAESSVGAKGLMQLMPDTADWIAKKLNMDSFRQEMLYDPETNIHLGCWYLSFLSSQFSGNPFCVVCAYHAGQNEVKGWLANPIYSTDGLTLIEERLPDDWPTKQYAGRVTRDYGIYQEKYFRPDLLSDPSVAAASGS